MMAEAVYVLTNVAVEGLVKIGRTTTSGEHPIRELDITSTPLPFQFFTLVKLRTMRRRGRWARMLTFGTTQRVYPVLGLDRSH